MSDPSLLSLLLIYEATNQLVTLQVDFSLTLPLALFTVRNEFPSFYSSPIAPLPSYLSLSSKPTLTTSRFQLQLRMPV